MAPIIHPLLTLLASLTRQELARQVTYPGVEKSWYPSARVAVQSAGYAVQNPS